MNTATIISLKARVEKLRAKQNKINRTGAQHMLESEQQKRDGTDKPPPKPSLEELENLVAQLRSSDRSLEARMLRGELRVARAQQGKC